MALLLKPFDFLKKIKYKNKGNNNRKYLKEFKATEIKIFKFSLKLTTKFGTMSMFNNDKKPIEIKKHKIYIGLTEKLYLNFEYSKNLSISNSGALAIINE